MHEPRTRQLPNSTVLFCIAVNRLGLAVTLQRQGTGIVVSDITGLGDRR